MTDRRTSRAVRTAALSTAVATSLAVAAQVVSAPAAGAGSAVTTSTAAAPAPPTCTDLVGTTIPAERFSLATRGGEVTAASRNTVVLDGVLVEYCRVDATIHSVDRSAPDIKMRVAMPTAWNHKGMMYGGGGYNGTIPDLQADVHYGPNGGPVPLARGYAMFASDSGHQADPTKHPVSSLDGSFGLNDEALRNFAAGDALKKTRDAAIFLIRKGYGEKPDLTYFAGGSTGGREALNVAQRWPRAFDGVISVFPAWDNAAEILYLGHLNQVLKKPGAFPNPDKQTTLYESVIAACDGLDGLEDGVVSDIRGCDFDPRTIRCEGGADTGSTCLSDRQIRAVEEMSSKWKWPYRIASGEKSYPGFPFLDGADMRTPLLGFGQTGPDDPMPYTAGYGLQFWDQYVRYFVTREPDHNSMEFDPAKPGKYLKRISFLSTLQDRNNADLRPFKRAGGKLLMIHGLADELVSHRSANRYFKRVQRILGKRATRSFMRYYTVPGANHGNIAPAFSASWDSVTTLERWRENGAAPRDQVVFDEGDSRSRPLCEFPAWPKYVGDDPDSADSFTCVRS